MALLTNALIRVAVLLLGVTALGSCAQSAPLGHVEVLLRDDDAGEGERVEAQAFIDPSASRYAPHGLYAYAELPRADGSIGLFELDVPTDAPQDAALPRFAASYRELVGERVRFASRAVRGQLVVPSELATEGDVGCECEDSGFALLFSDHGALRRLSFGRMGWAEQFCRPREDLAVPDELRLSRERCAIAVDATEPPAAAPSSDAVRTREPQLSPCAYGCYDEEPVVVGGGCEASDDEDDYAGDDGCGSATSDDDDDDDAATSSTTTSDTSSGCEGDTASDASDSGSSGGSCEGDTVDDDDDDPSSCTISRAPARPKHRAQRSRAFAGTGLPLAFSALLQAARARWLRVQSRPSVC